MAAHRCTVCATNWPIVWKTCPRGCGKLRNAAAMQPDHTVDETQSIVNHRRFAEWLENETPFDRARRQERAAKAEAEREAKRQARDAQFAQIVQGLDFAA